MLAGEDLLLGDDVAPLRLEPALERYRTPLS